MREWRKGKRMIIFSTLDDSSYYVLFESVCYVLTLFINGG